MVSAVFMLTLRLINPSQVSHSLSPSQLNQGTLKVLQNDHFLAAQHQQKGIINSEKSLTMAGIFMKSARE
jgi:hypothetical protein